MKPLTPSTPHAIVVVGIPGAGKSFFATQFSQTFKAPLLSVSALRQAGADAPTAAKVAAGFLDELLKTERTFIIDGVTDRKVERMELFRTIVKAGYRPLLVWVQTDQMEARRRSKKSGVGVPTREDAEFEHRLSAFQPPLPQETPVVISGKHTYATQVKSVLRHLATARTDRPSTGDAQRPDRPNSRGIIVR